MRPVHLHHISKMLPPRTPCLVPLLPLSRRPPQTFFYQQTPHRLVIYFDLVLRLQLLRIQHRTKSFVHSSIHLYYPLFYRSHDRPVPISTSQPMHKPLCPFLLISPHPPPALPVTYPQQPPRLRHSYLPTLHPLQYHQHVPFFLTHQYCPLFAHPITPSLRMIRHCHTGTFLLSSY